MKFRPLHDRVLVRRLEGDEKSPGGIIIPDKAKEKQFAGEVLAIGPGKRLKNGEIVPVDVKVGDQILFAKWEGCEIEIEDQKLVVVVEDHILGVMG